MESRCTHYSLYQTFFNRCLREWYVQFEGGAGFYYANPPGILFTRLRSSKQQKGAFVAPLSHWYFDGCDAPSARRAPWPARSSVIGGACAPSDSRPVASFLHLGYDLWYTRVLERLVPKFPHMRHVAFCHHYDVAFNTLYNVGRSLGLDPGGLETFRNFRLLTGNLFSLGTLLPEPRFKCVVLWVSPKSVKDVLHLRTLTALSDAMQNCGTLILLTGDRGASQRVRDVFNSERVSSLFEHRNVASHPDWSAPEFAGGDVEADEPSHAGHSHDPDVGDYLRCLAEFGFDADGVGAIRRALHVAVYTKRVSLLPNQMLRRPVDTK